MSDSFCKRCHVLLCKAPGPKGLCPKCAETTRNVHTAVTPPKLTPKQYVEKEGNECPFCGSDKLDLANGPDDCKTVIYIGVKCEDCGAEWNDRFELAGYDIIE